MLKILLLFTNELHTVKYDHLCSSNFFILYGIIVPPGDLFIETVRWLFEIQK